MISVVIDEHTPKKNEILDEPVPVPAINVVSSTDYDNCDNERPQEVNHYSRNYDEYCNNQPIERRKLLLP